MRIVNNMSAINAHRYLGINNGKLGKSLEKLSSGYAINRAGDNAAGLAVSEKMRSQIKGLTQATKNAQDGISMVQTYEGALTETDNILQRMKTLATQAANGTYDDAVDRSAIQLEFDQLRDELDQIADTDFNGVTVLNGGKFADGSVYENDAFTPLETPVDAQPGDGSVSVSNPYATGTAKLTYSDAVSLQVGSRTKDLVEFSFDYSYLTNVANGIGDLTADLNCNAEGLGTAALSLETQADANTAIDKIDNAINKVSLVRATFGSIQNRLEHKIDNMNTTNENITAAESRIRDADMAAEMMTFTKYNILNQASQSMLAQANQLPQGVLSLLQ